MSSVSATAIAQSFIADPQLEKTSPKQDSVYVNESPAGQLASNFNSSEFQWNSSCNKITEPLNTLAIKEGFILIRPTHIRDIQPSKSLFFQTNIGVGMLYFSGVSGNLAVIPPERTAFNGAFPSSPIKGRLSYNRTPLYEYIVGRRINNFFKMALSYQYQSGITVQTKLQPAPGIRPQLSANLTINAIMAKFYFESPYPLIQSKLSFSPYLGLGVGAVWQSWNQITETLSLVSGSLIEFRGDTINYRPVNPTSAAFSADLGFRLQRVTPYYPISVTMGIKYNLWGQARNIGQLTKQGNVKTGLLQPLNIRSLYQWAPYLGVQWNFTPSWKSNSPYEIDGKLASRGKPFITSLCKIKSPKSTWTQFNAGIGFLYFKNIRGLLKSNFQDPSFRQGAVNQVMSYNRTPLFEYLIGITPTRSFSPAISYQYQGNIAFQTGQLDAGFDRPERAQKIQLRSNLSLNSVMLKGYYTIPFALITRNTATSMYVGGGIGAGWQSWTATGSTFSRVMTASGVDYYGAGVVPIKQKIVANLVASGDAGLRFQSAYPNSPYSITAGMKFNYWGQARNIGLKTQQGSFNFADEYLTIKNVYQFSPYLGFQWDFLPSQCGKAPYTLSGKSVTRFWPFVAKTGQLERRNWLWTQFNTGLGLVYFSDVQANFMYTPQDLVFRITQSTNIPLSGRLTTNPGPLFEYLIGYTVFPCLKVGLSYQHQGGITVRSKALATASVENFRIGNRAVFTSNLALDGLTLKAYLESPYTFVSKGISTTPFVGVGGGVCWQSWTNTNVNYFSFALNGFLTAASVNFKQTLCTSGALTTDFGLNIQSAFPDSAFSIRPGCKFNLWGQARNIGAISKQSSAGYGLFKPLRIQTVYQWAPYLAVQWAF